MIAASAWAIAGVGVGGLEHHGVAERERRRGLPRRDRDREIPRRDQPEHADRLAISRDVEARAGSIRASGRGGAAPRRRNIGRCAPRASPRRCLRRRSCLPRATAARQAPWRAAMTIDPALVEHVGAHFRRGFRPGRESRASRLRGGVDFGRAALRVTGDDFVGVRRIDAFAERVAGAGHSPPMKWVRVSVIRPARAVAFGPSTGRARRGCASARERRTATARRRARW